MTVCWTPYRNPAVSSKRGVEECVLCLQLARLALATMKEQWLRTPGPSSYTSLRPAYHNDLNRQVSCKSDGRTKNGVRCHSQSQLGPRRYVCRRESRTNRACVAKGDVRVRSRDVHYRACRRSVLHVKRRGRAMKVAPTFPSTDGCEVK